jgi:hypothetical protein
MKEVLINKCDFCNKTSFNKSTIRQHEKRCFYNPATQSCATCLWFSPLYIFHEFQSYPIQCYAKKIKEVPEDHKLKLNTNCKKWMNFDLYLENETIENQDEMQDKLLCGNVNYFKALKSEGEKKSNNHHFLINN